MVSQAAAVEWTWAADNSEGMLLVGCEQGGDRQNWHIMAIKHVLVVRDGAVVVSVELAGWFRCAQEGGNTHWD